MQLQGMCGLRLSNETVKRMKRIFDNKKINHLIDQINVEKVYPLSIIEGFQSGEIYVDDTDKPTVALIWHYCGFANILGDYDDKIIGEILDMMHNPPEGHSGRMALQTENDPRLQDMIMCNPMISKRERYIFDFVNENIDIPDVMDCELQMILSNNYDLIKGKMIGGTYR